MKKRHITKFEQEKELLNLSVQETWSKEAKEEYHFNWRKHLESLIASKNNCTDKSKYSRRDFLTTGMAFGLAGVGAPMLTGTSVVDDVFAAQRPTLPGLLEFALRGGWHLTARHFVVGSKGSTGTGSANDLLTDTAYTRLSIPTTQSPSDPNNVETAFGVKFNKASSLLAGLKTGLGTDYDAVQAKTQGLIGIIASENDNGNDPHSATHIFARVVGSGVSTYVVGNGNNTTTRSGYPAGQPYSVASGQLVRSANDTQNLPGGGSPGDWAQGKFENPTAANDRIFATLKKLSEFGMADFGEKDMPTAIKSTLQNGYNDLYNLRTVPDPGTNIPTERADVGQIFNMNTGDENVVGTMTHLLTEGRVASAAVEKNGYDNHDGSFTSSDTIIQATGVLIGKALKLAAARQQPLAIYCASDGSMSGTNGFSGDDRRPAANFVLFYDPVAKPELAQAGEYQLGAYIKDDPNAGQDLALVPWADNKPDILANVFLANYLLWRKSTASWSKLGTGAPFSFDDFIKNKFARIKA